MIEITYVDNGSIDNVVYHIMETVIKPLKRDITPQEYCDMADKVRSIIGRYTGIRTEDDKDRLYDVTLLEGEPYVYDE